MSTTIKELETKFEKLQSDFVKQKADSEGVIKTQKLAIEGLIKQVNANSSEIKHLREKLDIANAVKELVVKNTKKEKSDIELDLNDKGIKGEAARAPYVSNINARVLPPNNYLNNNEFYKFYWNLKDAISSLDYAKDFELFEEKKFDELTGISSKILANYFTNHLIKTMPKEISAAIMKREDNKFDYLNGFVMLKNLWIHAVGPFETEFNARTTLNKIRFGENVDNVKVIEETLKFIRLAEKLYTTDLITTDEKVLEVLAGNVPKQICNELEKLVKDKNNRKFEKQIFVSNFKNLEDLLTVFKLWEVSKTETKHDVSNLFPGVSFAMINNIKKKTTKPEANNTEPAKTNGNSAAKNKHATKSQKAIGSLTTTPKGEPSEVDSTKKAYVVNAQNIQARQFTYFD